MSCDWPLITIGDFASLFTGFPFKSKDFSDVSGLKLLRGDNVAQGKLRWEKAKLWPQEQLIEKHCGYMLSEGDVILAMDRPWIEAGLKYAQITDADLPCLLVQRVSCLRANESSDQDFLRYIIGSRAFTEYVKLVQTGTAVPHISGKQILGFEFRLPPKNVRGFIGSVLSQLDNKITLNTQTNQTLEQMAQALFKSWFVDFDPVIDNALAAGNPIPEPLAKRAAQRQKLFAAEPCTNTDSAIHTDSTTNTDTATVAANRSATGDHSAQHCQQANQQPPARLPQATRDLFPNAFEEHPELGWIPKGWEVKPFGELLSQTIGGDWGKEVPDEKHTQQAVIIRGTDIPTLKGGLANAPSRWVEPKKLKTRSLALGDIVIEVSGGSPKQPTGRSLLITDNLLNRLGGVIEPASFCRKFKPVDRKTSILLHLHLQHIYEQGKTWEYQNQSTGISNFQTKTFLANELVPIPQQEALLDKLYDVVNPLLEKTTSNENIELAKLRDTLLPKLLSGELTLPEAQAEVENAG